MANKPGAVAAAIAAMMREDAAKSGVSVRIIVTPGGSGFMSDFGESVGLTERIEMATDKPATAVRVSKFSR